MIENESIKSSVHSYFAKDSDLSQYQKAAVEALTYVYVKDIMKAAGSSNDAVSITGSYGSQMKSKFLALEGKYVSYKRIIDLVEGAGASTVLSLTEPQIKTIYSYYCDQTEVAQFSDSYFSETMYGATGLTQREMDYLRKVHFAVMCPIAEYYAKLYGTSVGDLEIVECDSVKGNAGKVITFYVGGIDSGRVFSDMKTGRIGVSFLRAKCEYPYVTVTNE